MLILFERTVRHHSKTTCGVTRTTFVFAVVINYYYRIFMIIYRSSANSLLVALFQQTYLWTSVTDPRLLVVRVCSGNPIVYSFVVPDFLSDWRLGCCKNESLPASSSRSLKMSRENNHQLVKTVLRIIFLFSLGLTNFYSINFWKLHLIICRSKKITPLGRD